jgi:hypothetical protein
MDTVWCVFQRLPGERCATLVAVCVSEAAAARVVELERGEQTDDDAGTEWSVSAWSVLGEALDGVHDVTQISHVLDPMRVGLAVPPEEDGDESVPPQ